MTSDRGSAALLVLVWAAVLSLAGVAVASLGVLYAARAQATNAADAAALAAAPATYAPAGGRLPTVVARAAAQANGAILVECSCPPDSSMEVRVVTVWVGVEVAVPLFGSHTVVVPARAEFEPRRWLGR